MRISGVEPLQSSGLSTTDSSGRCGTAILVMAMIAVILVSDEFDDINGGRSQSSRRNDANDNKGMFCSN